MTTTAGSSILVALLVAPLPVLVSYVLANPMNRSDQEPDKVAKFGEQSLFKRPAQPEELAPAYVYLASEGDSSFVTGDIMGVLGGKASTR